MAAIISAVLAEVGVAAHQLVLLSVPGALELLVRVLRAVPALLMAVIDQVAGVAALAPPVQQRPAHQFLVLAVTEHSLLYFQLLLQSQYELANTLLLLMQYILLAAALAAHPLAVLQLLVRAAVVCKKHQAKLILVAVAVELVVPAM